MASSVCEASVSQRSDPTRDARRRALRLLAREHLADYTAIYEQVRPTARNSTQARDQARAQVRQRYPARYEELLAQEQASPLPDVPASIRSKSWQRSIARLADLRQVDYGRLFDRFRTQGMPRSRATARAMAALQEANQDLFDRLLSEEYELWMAASTTDEPAMEAQAGSGMGAAT
jgi:hypothetical protein